MRNSRLTASTDDAMTIAFIASNSSSASLVGTLHFMFQAEQSSPYRLAAGCETFEVVFGKTIHNTVTETLIPVGIEQIDSTLMMPN